MAADKETDLKKTGRERLLYELEIISGNYWGGAGNQL